ncbi:MAG: hypothetical protein M1300_04535 [Epsilonproteobacteria bacterium]|nr:hypothetical protein [Campylobacterota bacterium]
MKIVMTLMGKGGVGKSVASLIMAQYLSSKNEKLVCVDTDGVNFTFSRYEQLGALDRNVLSNEGERADLTKIDSLFNDLLENPDFQDKTVLIDNGASSFVPIRGYLMQSGVLDMDLDITILVPLMAGESAESTIQGAVDLLSDIGPKAKYVVIENQRDGIVPFTKTKIEKLFKDSGTYLGSVVIPQIDPKSLIGADYATAVENCLLFSDIDATDKLKIMSKSRLKQFYQKIFAQLEAIGV